MKVDPSHLKSYLKCRFLQCPRKLWWPAHMIKKWFGGRHYGLGGGSIEIAFGIHSPGSALGSWYLLRNDATWLMGLLWWDSNLVWWWYGMRCVFAIVGPTWQAYNGPNFLGILMLINTWDFVKNYYYYTKCLRGYCSFLWYINCPVTSRHAEELKIRNSKMRKKK